MRSEYSDLKWCVWMMNWQGEKLCWLIFIVNLTEFRSTHETHSWVCLWRHLQKDLGAGKTLSESGRYHNMDWHLELNWNENVNRMLIFPSRCFRTLDTIRLAATIPQHHAFLVIMNRCLKLWAQIRHFPLKLVFLIKYFLRAFWKVIKKICNVASYAGISQGVWPGTDMLGIAESTGILL